MASQLLERTRSLLRNLLLALRDRRSLLHRLFRTNSRCRPSLFLKMLFFGVVVLDSLQNLVRTDFARKQDLLLGVWYGLSRQSA